MSWRIRDVRVIASLECCECGHWQDFTGLAGKSYTALLLAAVAADGWRENNDGELCRECASKEQRDE